MKEIYEVSEELAASLDRQQKYADELEVFNPFAAFRGDDSMNTLAKLVMIVGVLGSVALVITVIAIGGLAVHGIIGGGICG